jgi:hypothetical protein
MCSFAVRVSEGKMNALKIRGGKTFRFTLMGYVLWQQYCCYSSCLLQVDLDQHPLTDFTKRFIGISLMGTMP